LRAGRRQFTTANSDLVNNAVRAIGIEDPRKIWFGTNGGISLYEISEGIIMDDKK